MPDKRKSRRRAVVLIGAGRMGTALLNGWIAAGVAPIDVVEPNPAPDIKRFARARKITLHNQVEDAGARAGAVCVIAIKPQVLKTEAHRLRALADGGSLIVSIAAGTSTKSLRRACGAGARIVRAMPNLPGAIGKGISAIYAARGATPADRAAVESLLGALGEVVWVPKEAMIDAATAISGSGPAYAFLLVEALAQAAEAEGLSPAVAMRLARATVAGAGALLDADSRPAGQLRRDVTSPGGTTEAALAVLMANDALATLMARAVAAARKRAEELSG